jgi:FkbM family methyltransferase
MNINKKELIEKIVSSEPVNCDLFIKILESLNQESKKNITMMELGCSAAIYSALFYEFFQEKAKNIMVEPVLSWWESFGASYFKDKPNTYFYNNYVGPLIWAHWGGSSSDQAVNLAKEIPQISLDQILQESNTDFVDLLHMDLQGAEYFILEDIIKNKMIEKFKYIILMTHNMSELNIKYDDYIKLLTNSNIKHEFIFNNSNYIDPTNDGLIIVKIN